ncbi:N-(5'-phosphoribosyl)anthranilate isomerase [Defluviimonas sp. 20V17]|uniref:N-(5'-phosphoribosyl)anthranilate isomerase n=2 Tax=Allgaiera indica TaxID=765699 RepID=A0AAN4UUJ5_9RHOB|nr:hypothetical protein [Allgaiera indica]KDB04445.1 N-(5'-phosphoribosyl)anthranilate isomerase [Defluviimonas sp. 20V17]GHE05157.1 hypothetical protein GCM10008024_34980 [Allgaiera indica]
MEIGVHHQSECWIEHMFAAKAVTRGGVIRRSVAWVEHEIGRERLIAEVRARGFCLLECGGQFVVICQRGAIRRLV